LLQFKDQIVDSLALREERAAIVQYDANVPREWAEGFAKLSAMLPPANVSEERWQQFIDDCGHFMDKWAGLAAQLGWKPADLFGVARPMPAATSSRHLLATDLLEGVRDEAA
jgi:hypothetical protein